MISIISTPEELRQQGFAALVAALGWVNAVRFIQQYESGQGDYTRERDHILPDWDAETLVQKAREQISGYSRRRIFAPCSACTIFPHSL